MAVATYPITDIQRDGPRDRSYTYIMAIPAGGGGTDHAFLGPVETLPEPGNCLGIHVSANPSGDGHVLTVYGTFDSATITASGRNWFIARGDTASGINVPLNAVNAVTANARFVKAYSPARSYRFRVSGPTGLTAGLKIQAMIITSPRG